MTGYERVDLSDVPVSALRPATKEKVCTMLNFNLVIPSPAGLPRDWRGLAQLVNVKPPCGFMPNPTGHILSQFEKQPGSTLTKLQEAFGELDRWDVYDDTEEMFHADGKNYLQVIQNSPESTCSPHLDFLTDDIVTLDDLHRAKSNLPPLIYDAFLLFAEEDEDFAVMAVNKLEKEYLAKVCYKDRDFIAGLPLEHISVMKMLKERCHRLIVIISNNFIRSEFNKYFLNFASAVSIEQRSMKIIPIVLEYCPDLPMVVRFCHLLDYTRRSKLWDFWEKLGTAVVNNRMLADVSCSFMDMSKRLMLEDAEKKPMAKKEFYEEESDPKQVTSNWKSMDEHLEKEHQCTEKSKKSDKKSKIGTGVLFKFAKKKLLKKIKN